MNNQRNYSIISHVSSKVLIYVINNIKAAKLHYALKLLVLEKYNTLRLI